jgi:hypothetical protein
MGNFFLCGFGVRRLICVGLSRAAVNPSMGAASKTSMFCTPRKRPTQTMRRSSGLRGVEGGLRQRADAQVPGGEPDFNEKGDVCAGDEQHCAYEEQGDGPCET